MNQHSIPQPLTQGVSARLVVSLRPIQELRIAPSNPRIHSKRQINQIASSIRAFGFNVPVLVDSQNRVIAGHGRIQAAAQLGWAEVPTICLDHLTAHQAKAFMIADNRLSEQSTWDERLLGEALRDLSLQDLDFNLEATGFEMAEIDILIEGLEEDHRKDDPADEIPPLPPTAISMLGDLWALGEHRILCGNALSSDDLTRLMGDRLASVVFVDPPYNVPIQGHVGGLGRVQHREFAMASGEMTEAEFVAFLSTATQGLARHSKEGSIHFICMDWKHAGELITAGKTAYSELKNLCVWVKDNAGMGSFYRSKHELIFVFKYGQVPHQNHVQLGRFGRYRTNVWQYPGVNSFARATDEGNLLELHPTVKPVALVADALKDASSRGDIVLDTFLGSGTTLIAANRTGRICFGIELDPLYVDVIIRRWRSQTGQAAIHIDSGLPFEDLADQRAKAPTAIEGGQA